MIKMEYKLIAQNTPIAALGLGTWKIGGNIISADHTRDHDYILAIQRAVNAGLTHIDTAEIYGVGHTEELVGKAIKKFDRQKLFITSKISPHHLFTQNQILNHAYQSLQRLAISYLDLYLIHAPNPLVSIKSVMEVFDKLIGLELVRFIGVSNFSKNQLITAQKFAKNKIVTNQIHYSLLHQDPKKELLPYCQKTGVALTAYSPLEQGQLVAGRFPQLDQIAPKYKKTASQVAIRWLLDQENVITIPKITTKAHLQEVLGSLNWHLRKEDRKVLNNFP